MRRLACPCRAFGSADVLSIFSVAWQLHATGEKYIEPAILSARVSAARVALEAARHLRNPQSIDKLFDQATPHLREARSALANPAMLPPSFRNRRCGFRRTLA
jgi:hypothetical protein